MGKSQFIFKIIVLLGLMILGLLGCSPVSLYSVDMIYDVKKATPPAYFKAEEKTQNAIIVVAEFNDKRIIGDKKIIGRVVEKDGTNVMVFPKYIIPTKIIADGIKSYFEKAAYKVVDKKLSWDLKEEQIPDMQAKILVGGSIDEMEIICRRGFPANSYEAGIKLTVVFVDLSKKRIVYTRKVEASSSKENISFSEEHMGNYISDLLTESVNSIFEDKNVSQKIKEVIAQ